MRMLAVILAATTTAAVAQDRSPPVLLAFGSSDSCAWCDLLDARVFASDEWRKWSATNIVYKAVDLPRGSGALSRGEREENEALADRYGIEGIPTFVLVTPDGKTELGRVKVPDPSCGLGRDLTASDFIAAMRKTISTAPPAPTHPPPTHTFRFVPVVAFLGLAAALLTDKSRLPLVLRGLKKTLERNTEKTPYAPPPAWKRALAFLLILLAFAVAVL